MGPKDASTLVARQYKYEVAKDSVRRAVMRLQYRFHTSSLSYTINWHLVSKRSFFSLIQIVNNRVKESKKCGYDIESWFLLIYAALWWT